MSCASLPVILTPDQNLNKHGLFTFGMPITRKIYLQMYKLRKCEIMQQSHIGNLFFNKYLL